MLLKRLWPGIWLRHATAIHSHHLALHRATRRLTGVARGASDASRDARPHLSLAAALQPIYPFAAKPRLPPLVRALRYREAVPPAADAYGTFAARNACCGCGPKWSAATQSRCHTAVYVVRDLGYGTPAARGGRCPSCLTSRRALRLALRRRSRGRRAGVCARGVRRRCGASVGARGHRPVRDRGGPGPRPPGACGASSDKRRFRGMPTEAPIGWPTRWPSAEQAVPRPRPPAATVGRRTRGDQGTDARGCRDSSRAGREEEGGRG